MTAPAAQSFNKATIRRTPSGRQIRIKLPPSSRPIAQWSVNTPEQDDDDDDDWSDIESESEHSVNSDDASEDGSWYSEALSEEESSDDDLNEFDDEIPKEELASLLLEAKLSVPIAVPYAIAIESLEKAITERDTNDSKETTLVPQKNGKVSETGDSRTASTSATDDKASSSSSRKSSLTNDTSLLQTTPSNVSALRLTAALNSNTAPSLSAYLPMSISNHLLFNEVFKIQKIDGQFHRCRYLDEQGTQCDSNVSKSHSLSITAVENKLRTVDVFTLDQIYSLALYSMCPTHIKQSEKLAKVWIRLAKLTKVTRKFWLKRQRSIPVASENLKERYTWNTEFASYAINHLLARDKLEWKSLSHIDLFDTWDKISVIENSSPKEAVQKITEDELRIHREYHQHDHKVNCPGEKSQEAVEELQTDVSSFSNSMVNELELQNLSLREAIQKTAEDELWIQREHDQHNDKVNDPREESQDPVEELRKEVSSLNSTVKGLKAENSSLKESKGATEEILAAERKRGQQDLQDAQEAFGKEIDTANSRIRELTTKESSLQNSLESTQDALTKEKVRSRELEIRLEERGAPGIKASDTHETKLEKYLREELEKSQRRVLQQLQDLQKLRDDHVRLQITNATLEGQVKEIEVVKEKFQKVTEMNSVLQRQLQGTRAQCEQLAYLAAMEKDNGVEATKRKFRFRDIYKRPKPETSRLQTPMDQ